MRNHEKPNQPNPEITRVRVLQPKLGEIALKCAGCPFKRLCDQQPAPDCESKEEQKVISQDNLKEAIMDDSISSIYLAKNGRDYIAIQQESIKAREKALAKAQAEKIKPATKTIRPEPKPTEKKEPRTNRPAIIHLIEKAISEAIA